MILIVDQIVDGRATLYCDEEPSVRVELPTVELPGAKVGDTFELEIL